MSVTVRRRVPRFDAGGFVPSGPMQGGLSSGGGGAGGLIGNPGGSGRSSPSPSSTATDPGSLDPLASSFGGSQGIPLHAPSSGGYTPPDFSAIPAPQAPVSNGFYAKAQGLPSPTPQGGQFSAGPESNNAGSWGAAATNGIQGNPGGNYSQPAPNIQGTYQRPGTVGNYGTYQAKVTLPWATPQQPNSYPLGLIEGSPNYASGGPVQEFRHGGHAGGFSGPGVPSGVDVGPQTSDYRPLAQQQHDFAQADTVGRINKYFSQEKPVQDAIAGEKPQPAIPEQQPVQPQKQQRQPQQHPMQRRAAQQAQQRASDNGLAQKLMSAGNKAVQPGVGAGGQGPSQDPGQAQATPQQSSPQSDSGSAGAIPDDSAGVEAGAEAGGLATGGQVPGFAEGGAIPEKDPAATKKARDPRAGVKMALSHTRQKFGLNDQVFGDMAQRLQGGHYFASGGGVEDVDAEAHGGPGQEDLAAEDLPYKIGSREGQEDLKAEAESDFGYEDGGAIPDDDGGDAETEVEKVAGMIPTKPAGPGGDQPNPNPFPTKTPNPPFGKRTAKREDDNDADDA